MAEDKPTRATRASTSESDPHAEAQEKGYYGETPDPTPNENYTVAGNDLPTPETDPELAAEVTKRLSWFSDESQARREAEPKG